LIDNNGSMPLIPQLLGNGAKEILPIALEVAKMGYSEINLNLGCPYSMVTKKTMGAGLLPFPDKVNEILNELASKTAMRISVKMRLGLTNADDWKALVPVLNNYPLTEVIIHGRTATQMYKGEIDVEAFKAMAKELKHPVCYNGNIFELENFQDLSKKFPFAERWMLGRGLLSNPLLMNEIRTGEKASKAEVQAAIGKLHEQLLYFNSIRLSGNSHLFNKIKPYWEYFAEAFAENPKGLKKIKKTTSLESYKLACNEIFR
jgi:tRNA-dihydrouridine synthase B